MKGIKALKAALIGAMFMIPTLAYGQAYGTVATETLNVREGAKLESPIVKQVGLGEKVEIVHQQDGWLKIILKNDERAYVKAEYINVNRVASIMLSSIILFASSPRIRLFSALVDFPISFSVVFASLRSFRCCVSFSRSLYTFSSFRSP